MRALAAGAAAAALIVALPAAADPPRVLVAEATRVDFPLTVEAPGTARANESVEVRPKVSETVTAIHFEEGQRVETGQILLELEASQASAAVAAARAELVESEGQARRAEELFKTKAISASELEQRQALRDADRAALDAARARLADTRLRAPFAGRVGLRNVSLGSYVTPDTVVTTLDDTDEMKLDFDVPETSLALLSEGLPVQARSVAWPDRTFRGEVASIDTRIDPVTRTVTVRARLPNPEGLLRPGMFLTVTLLRENMRALVIPEQALVPEQSRQYVFVVGAGGLVEKREVHTGRRRPGQVEVRSGLAEGDLVIAEGTQKVRPGEPVEVSGRVEVAERDVP